MSVEFSGQSMKSGIGDLAEPGPRHQVDGLGEVVVGHRPGPAHRLDPRPGNVALHDADVRPTRPPVRRLRPGRAADRPAQQQHDDDRDAGQHQRPHPRAPVLAASTSSVQDHPGDQLGRSARRRTTARRRRSAAGSRPAGCPRRRRRAGSSRTHRTGPGRTRTRSAPSSGGGQRPPAQPADQVEASPSSPKNRASNTISRAATQTPSTCSQLIATVSMRQPEQVAEPERAAQVG